MDPSTSFDSDRRSSRRRHLWGFSALFAAVVLLIVMTFNAIQATNRRQAAERWQMHTMQVLLAIEKTRSGANQALRGERGYLITRDRRFLATLEAGSDESLRGASHLRALTADHAGQSARVAVLDGQLARLMKLLADTAALARRGDGAEAAAVVRTALGRDAIESVLATLDGIDAEERRLRAQRAAEADRAARALDLADYALSALALLFLIGVGAAGYGASRARIRTLSAESLLRRAATTDELTGLLNRRAFLAALETEIARSGRSGAPMSLAIVDLDHFKQVNDRFGHHGGDEALRRFAEVARDTVRTADMVGRLGGEEFAVLMPETDSTAASIAAERLRDAVARRRMALPSGMLSVTISSGVAQYARGEAPEELIHRADEALYEAKHGGRNRTRLAA